MSYRVKKGKEKTFISGLILGDCSPGDLQRLADTGDLRFIEEVEDPEPEVKPKRKPKVKDKENKENES